MTPLNVPLAFLCFVLITGIALAVVANGTTDGSDAE